MLGFQVKFLLLQVRGGPMWTKTTLLLEDSYTAIHPPSMALPFSSFCFGLFSGDSSLSWNLAACSSYYHYSILFTLACERARVINQNWVHTQCSILTLRDWKEHSRLSSLRRSLDMGQRLFTDSEFGFIRKTFYTVLQIWQIRWII